MTALSRNGYETLDNTIRQYCRLVNINFDAAEKMLWNRYSHVQATNGGVTIQDLVRHAALVPWEIAFSSVGSRLEDWKDDNRDRYGVHIYAGQSIGQRLPE